MSDRPMRDFLIKKLGGDSGEAGKYLDQFSKNTAIMESADGKMIDYPKKNDGTQASSALGVYQFLTTAKDKLKPGEFNAFETAMRRYENTLGSTPDWITKAKKHNDPRKLTRTQQEELFFANVYQQKGSSAYLKGVMRGSMEAQRGAYSRYHHTNTDDATKRRMAEVFK